MHQRMLGLHLNVINVDLSEDLVSELIVQPLPHITSQHEQLIRIK